MIVQPLKPLYNNESKTLILGSFPSVKSRELNFFYAHPQNRFWKVISAIYNSEVPSTIEEKTKLILNNNLALYDVIYSCDITSSADSSIKNVTPSNLTEVIKNSKIDRIFVNGKTAEFYYKKYLEKSLNISCVSLPSTSPANATFSLEKLIKAWSIVKD